MGSKRRADNWLCFPNVPFRMCEGGEVRVFVSGHVGIARGMTGGYGGSRR
jgi:hypothetical protein